MKARKTSLIIAHLTILFTNIRWNPNPREEKGFYDRLSAFHQKQGTQFNRYPVLGFRDLNLFRLSKTVEKHGGFSAVCGGLDEGYLSPRCQVSKAKHWRAVYEDMGFEPRSVGANLIKAAFEK
jgi:hypothetical protein